MSDDRALLGAAAKAAGMKILPEGLWPSNAVGWFYNEHGRNGGGMFYVNGRAPIESWNPLIDDGDALRLACKLEMHILIVGEGMCEVKCPERNLAPIWEHVAGSNTALATRRCIVRAAASMAPKETP